MISSVGFTLSGLIFALLIAIIYFSKKKFAGVEHKLFGFLLLWTIFLLLLEFYCVFTMRYRNLHPVLNEVLCRTYAFGATMWIISVVIYTIILNDKDSYKTMKDVIKKPINSIALAFGFVMFIISCFQPLTYTSGIHNELYVIGGPAITYMYIVSVFVGAYLFYILIRNKNKASLFKRSPIIFFIVAYLIMFGIQYIYTDFNDLTFMFSLVVVAMYFTVVSQDYKLVTDLEEATVIAEKANEDKTEFLSRMSHEIRTPMNAIMGFSESLLADKENLTKEKILDNASNIRIAGNNLVTTINNILDITNIESGNVTIHEQKYYIGEILYELQEYALPRIDSSRVNFIMEIDENIPKALFGDSDKIKKILLNILGNSVKYTVTGEIRVNVSAIVENGFANLKFVISDSGLGIKDEDYDKVFVKFAKLELDSKEIEGGAGLGLAISKSLVDMMDGTIYFTSSHNVGTTFTVSLKNKVIDYHKFGTLDEYIESLKQLKEKLDCTGKKIMIVDDNKLNLKVIYNMLKKYNAEVIMVDSGKHCVELIESNEHYDLLIIDHLMPDLNGLDTMNKLKELNKDNLPPVIVTTANITEELKNMYQQVGFSGYLTKPIDEKRLSTLLEYYFKK